MSAKIREFSYKHNEHYIELKTGKKFHAPKGLSYLITCWCVERFGVLKRFPIKRYDDAYNFLMELNRSNLEDPSLHHVTRFKKEKPHKRFHFNETCVSVSFVIPKDRRRVYAQLSYYDPVGKKKVYLRGSSISLNKISDYRPDMHAESVVEAKRIRRNLLLLENAILASLSEEEANHV